MPEPISLSITERLILANQYEILSQQARDKSDISKYRSIAQQLRDGHKYLYNQIFRNIKEDLNDENTNFVLDVLELHQVLLKNYDELTENSPIPLTEKHITFKGFHRHQEDDLISFVFALDRQGYYRAVTKAGDFSSVNPMKDTYKQMIEKWKQLGKNRQLSLEQILQIIEK